jgi:hypothetical protein
MTPQSSCTNADALAAWQNRLSTSLSSFHEQTVQIEHGLPLCRQNIDSKFFSYWGTIVALLVGMPCLEAAITLFVSGTNGWHPLTLAAGAAMMVPIFGLTTF